MKNMYRILAGALLCGIIVACATMFSSQPKAAEVNDLAKLPQEIIAVEEEDCDFFKGDTDCPLTDKQVKILDEPHFIGSEEATRLMEIEVPEDSIFKLNW